MSEAWFGLLFLVFAVLGVALLAFWIWALVDCVQVPDDSMFQSGTKLIWVLIIVFASWIGAILYVAIGRPKRESGGAPPRGNGRAPGSGEGPPMPPPPL
jgi:hypothetical protein